MGFLPSAAKTADYYVGAADFGKVLTTRGATGAVVFTLPVAAAGDAGNWVIFVNAVDQNMTIQTQTANQMITFNDLDADAIAFATASEKIGACAMAISDGTSWFLVPLIFEAVTITVTT